MMYIGFVIRYSTLFRVVSATKYPFPWDSPMAIQIEALWASCKSARNRLALCRKTLFSAISPTLVAILSPPNPKPYFLINKVEVRGIIYATKVWKKKNKVFKNCTESFLTIPAGWHECKNVGAKKSVRHR